VLAATVLAGALVVSLTSLEQLARAATRATGTIETKKRREITSANVLAHSASASFINASIRGPFVARPRNQPWLFMVFATVAVTFVDGVDIKVTHR
jgi:hypothetical protein